LKEAAMFAIAYDLSDDRERYRVDRVLRGFGFRVQKSVFECRLSRATRAALFRALETLDLKSGGVRCYRVYAVGGRDHFGRRSEDPDDEVIYAV